MEQMTLEEFNRLANGDRVTLAAALELLLPNGRGVIQRETSVTLAANWRERLGGFFAEETLRGIADVCQQLAALDTNVLVGYIRRGDLDIKLPNAEEAGTCPICGGELDYEDDIHTDDGGFFLWKCPGCGATGKEGYDKVFDQHYDVRDRDGKPFPVPAKQRFSNKYYTDPGDMGIACIPRNGRKGS